MIRLKPNLPAIFCRYSCLPWLHGLQFYCKTFSGLRTAASRSRAPAAHLLALSVRCTNAERVASLAGGSAVVK